MQARARGKKEGAELSLNFRKQLAKCMIFNKLGDNGVAPKSPICFKLMRNNQHEQKRKLVGEGNGMRQQDHSIQ